MGLLEPKNKVVGTTGTGSVLLTIGTIELVSVLPIKTLWQLKIRSSVLPAQCWKYHPPKNHPAKQPQTVDRRISQTTWSLETKFWGDDEHHKERLCPNNYSLKLPTTPGIANPCQEHYDLGFIQKSTNRRPNPAFEGSRSSPNMNKALTHDLLKEIQREMPSNLWKQAKNKGTKTAPKKQQKQLRIERLAQDFEDEFTVNILFNRLQDTPRILLTVKIRQPSHEFTFGVGMSFIPYPLVLTLVV
jgi:hypothetical protein